MQTKPKAVFSEIETLTITGSHSEIDRFHQKVAKIMRHRDLGISMSIVVPEKPPQDSSQGEPDSFLDLFFVDKIPLIHDFLMMGEPEVQLLKVEGSHDMVNRFNAHVARMIRREEMNVTVAVVNRKKIPLEQTVSNGLDHVESTLDYYFTDDFSRSMPVVHKIIMGSA